MTLITIITVVFNGRAQIENTIKSVVNSGYKDLRYIVIDGGSTDGTVALIEKYAQHLSYWVSEPDLGIYDAMNKGWEKAEQNSYILYLGCGDKILSLPTFLDENLATAYYGDVYIGNVLFKSKRDFTSTLGNTLHHQALLVPKSLNVEPPFDTRFRVYADFDFNLRLMKRGVKFLYSADLKAFAQPGGLSSRKDDGEMSRVVKHNYGHVRALLALFFYKLQAVKASWH